MPLLDTENGIEAFLVENRISRMRGNIKREEVFHYRTIPAVEVNNVSAVAGSSYTYKLYFCFGKSHMYLTVNIKML